MSETLRVDGAELSYVTRPGADPAGVPFVFQHGMGGDVSQPLGYLGDDPPGPVVSLNARGHAPSADLVDPADARFETFAADVLALADRLGLERFVAGGISMGAATALTLAARAPQRVSGLVLCRPAWVDAPQPAANRAAYAEIADRLAEAGPDADPAALADRFRASATFARVHAESPAAAASLIGQFTRPRAAANRLLLRALPADAPAAGTPLESLDVPTLVIGHRGDPFHPWAMAAELADRIPGARLVEVPSKDADAAGFAREIRAALRAFLA